MTKKTIQEDPLDALLPGKARKTTPKPKDGPKPDPETEKERLTVHVPKSVVRRAKTAVLHTPGLTLSDLAEKALSEAVDKLERDRKEPFPETVKVRLKGGRPLKIN